MTGQEEQAMPFRVPVRGRPRPAMDSDTRFFWDAAAQGRLAIQKCSSCGLLRHPPGPACPRCHCLEWEATEVTGRGTLYSYTIVHHPLPPGFDEPAVVVLVDLEEGVRVVSNMSASDARAPRIGEPLEAYFVRQDEGWTAPQFRRPTAKDSHVRPSAASGGPG
jgi:uncharacterized protein